MRMQSIPFVQTVKYTTSASSRYLSIFRCISGSALYSIYTIYFIHAAVIYHQEKYQLSAAKTGSDSEVLLQLYRCKGPEFVKELNGIFGFVCVGDDGDKILAARDHCGIKPLYMGYGKNGSIWFASELKAICDQCETIEEFPAGYYWTPFSGFVKYYSPEWDDDNFVGYKVMK